MHNYLIKGGRVVDPASGFDDIADVLIEKGIIKNIAKNISPNKLDIQEINAQGLIVCPALFDMHVHFREPGGESKETFETGLKAAIAGGVGFSLAMPNTNPKTDNAELLKINSDRANSLNLGKVYFAAHISKNAEGIELADIKSLKNAGCVALKAFPREHDNGEFFKKALLEAGRNNLVIICHAEIINHLEGEHSVQSEIDAVGKILKVNKNINARIHFAHISTSGAVELIQEAKKIGLNITSEACPHHLFLTEKEFKIKKGFARTNPPLRDEGNRKAVFDAVINGLIDVFATDHAPHSLEEKMQDFDKSPPGTTGIETLFASINTHYVQKGLLSISSVIAMMTIAPAKILDVPAPSMQIDTQANIAIFDLNKKWSVKGDELFTKAKSSIFEGAEFFGKTEYVFINGEVKLINERFL